MKALLYRHPGCPYAHRVAIALQEKQLDWEAQVKPDAPGPTWLIAAPPRGREPALYVDGKILYGAVAIVEYLEDAHPQRPLRSDDLFRRAAERAWFALSDSLLLSPLRDMITAPTEAAFRDAYAQLCHGLWHLARVLGRRNWLSHGGERFGLADAAVAPAMVYIEALHDAGTFDWPEDCERVRNWSRRVTARPSVAYTGTHDLLSAIDAVLELGGGSYLRSLARMRTGAEEKTGMFASLATRTSGVRRRVDRGDDDTAARSGGDDRGLYFMVANDRRRDR